MTEVKTLWPILMVDNEWNDIADLDGLLEEIEVKIQLNEEIATGYRIASRSANLREYVAHAYEAINSMKEKMDGGERYSAIISDNHLSEDEGDTLDGDDFLRVIIGKPTYCVTKEKDDADIELKEIMSCGSFREILEYSGKRVGKDNTILDFLEYNFSNPEQYFRFVNYFFGENSPYIELIMLCGTIKGADLRGIEDRIVPVQKKMKTGRCINHHCERRILEYLAERDIIPGGYITEPLRNHYRIGDDVNPNQRAFKKIPKKN